MRFTNIRTRLFALAAVVGLAASPAVGMAAPPGGGAPGADRQGPGVLPSYGLSVSFDLEKNLVRGRAEITIPEGVEVDVSTAGLRVTSLRLDGAPVSVEPEIESLSFLQKGTVEIGYEAAFPEGSEGGLISEDGISLTGRWYPELKGMARYSVRALLPEGFTAVSEAEEVSVAERPGGREFTFGFPHPLQGVDLAAGRYVQSSDSMGDVKIYAYFFKEDAGLAEGYIAHAKEFLALYDGLLTPYPYGRFSIVENVLPTGYSMPTFTLLGRAVVRLPFIEKTSLGHEILHQWFGNSVYCDYAAGNWLEGLTTDLADQLYRERQGEGWQYRKGLLTKYQAYVHPDGAAPLLDFVDAESGPVMRAIGYGKGAMFFHMLKGLVGEEAFYASLRSFIGKNMFRRASWRDIRAAFEENTGEDLLWFFRQWLTRKDVPSG
jgi:aminopeptidase N